MRSRQAETELGLEESLTVGRAVMSPVLHGGGRSRCVESDLSTLPPLPKFVACLQVGSTKFTNCSPSARIESSLELKLRALLPTTSSLMYPRLVVLLTPLLLAAEVSF